MRPILRPLFVLLTLLCLPALAFAQAAPVPDVTDLPSLMQSMIAGFGSHAWTTVATSALMLAAFATRFLTAKEKNPFFHSTTWLTISSAAVAIFMIVARTITDKGFSASAISGAIIMGLLTSGLLNNPTPTGVVQTVPAPNQSGFARLSMMAILIPVSLLAACACWRATDPKYSTPECIIARQSVDCTIAAFKDEAGRGLALVTQLIASGTVNVDMLLTALKDAGFQSGECIIASAAKDFGAKGTGASPNEAAFLANWHKWRGAKRPGVIYKGADPKNTACIGRPVA